MGRSCSNWRFGSENPDLDCYYYYWGGTEPEWQKNSSESLKGKLVLCSNGKHVLFFTDIVLM